MISKVISDDIPPQMNIMNMVIPILCTSAVSSHMGAFQARHPTTCDVINVVKPFPTVCRRINCRKFLTLSNQKSRYKSMQTVA